MSSAPRDPTDETSRRKRRLDELRRLYDRAAPECLRRSYARELYLCHSEALNARRRDSAAALLFELREVVGPAAGAAPSAMVLESRLWLMRALVDAQRVALKEDRTSAAEAFFAQLEHLVDATPECEDLGVVWCEALEHAHAAAVRNGFADVAASRLDELHDVARGEAATLRLARALERAHAAAIRRQPEEASVCLDDLRRLARRGYATGYERAALTGALRLAVERGVGGEELVDELAYWSRRPGAVEESRRDLAAAMSVVEERGAHCWPDPPIERLRTRAYRSEATPSERSALFDELEASTLQDDLPFGDFMGALAEMRALAEGDDGAPTLRLRFAACWLRFRIDAHRAKCGAERSDKMAYLWSLREAHRGDAVAQTLVGHCYRSGRGAPRSSTRARRWYTVAAASGSSEAEFWLRQTAVGRFGAVFYRGRLLLAIGIAALGFYLWRYGIAIDPLGVAAHALVLLFGQSLAFKLFNAIGGDPEAPADPDDWHASRVVEYLKGGFWRVLGVVGEDGLTLVPLLLLGLPTWATAILAAAIFGFLHYPSFSIPRCAAKGVSYGIGVALILPWAGLASLALAHVLLDVVIVLVGRGLTVGQPAPDSQTPDAPA